MKIPAEALAYYQNEGGNKAAGDPTRTEPIGAGAGVQTNLSGQTPYRWSAIWNGTTPAPPPKAPAERDERRQGDRRQRNQPVLLDTRLKQRRRQSEPYPRISFEI